MGKYVYRLQDYEPYAKAEQEYLTLAKQRSELIVRYKEEAGRLRREANAALSKAMLVQAAAAMRLDSPKKAERVMQEAKELINQAKAAEELAAEAEKKNGWLDQAIAAKGEELKALQKEAVRYLLPKVKANHAPAVAKVARLLRELAEAVREEREIAQVAESALVTPDRVFFMPLYAPPFADALLDIDRQGVVWSWLRDAEKYLAEAAAGDKNSGMLPEAAAGGDKTGLLQRFIEKKEA